MQDTSPSAAFRLERRFEEGDDSELDPGSVVGSGSVRMAITGVTMSLCMEKKGGRMDTVCIDG